MQGRASGHVTLRSHVVSFMRQHQEDFEPFIEDDEAFDRYCSRMEKASLCQLAMVWPCNT